MKNPLGSMLFAHVKMTLEMIKARRKVTHGGALGWLTPKPLELWMSTPEIYDAVLATTIVQSRRSGMAGLKALRDLKVAKERKR